ncbi:MAG: hypothetical protein JWO81_787 [Alphaproteobacteria bacterium]|nr:hypothetical protein [Alphaproteobacteria bacterium]
MTRARTLFATAALLVAGAAIAQPGSAPPPAPGPGTSGGVPGTNNPYARPSDMGEMDSATMPSSMDQIRRGTQAASDARAAERARRENGSAVPAKPSDLVASAAISDVNGQPIGTIDSVDAEGAVVVTVAGKVKVPLNAFGKNRKGLLIGMTKKDFEVLVAKANATPAG